MNVLGYDATVEICWCCGGALVNFHLNT